MITKIDLFIICVFFFWGVDILYMSFYLFFHPSSCPSSSFSSLIICFTSVVYFLGLIFFRVDIFVIPLYIDVIDDHYNPSFHSFTSTNIHMHPYFYIFLFIFCIGNTFVCIWFSYVSNEKGVDFFKICDPFRVLVI